MNYKIIRDDNKLKEFIDMLPDLQSGETYLIRLKTRSKYVKELKNDIELRSLTSTKKDFVNSIKQLECEIGSYMNLSDDNLGIYCSPNPRSYKKMINEILIRFSKMAGNYKGEDIEFIFYNHLRNCYSRQIYFDVDFDKCDINYTINKVKEYINSECVQLLYTKNGIHFIIKLDDVDIVNYPDWHKNISLLPKYDPTCPGDNNIPIPGCSQFGFVPYLENLI